MTFYETINLNRLKIEYMVGANKKTSIIKTAARLFSLQGYEATTTLQIARETGITEPAVFYHFKNKNTLFAEIIKDASARYIKRLEALDNSDRSPFDRIAELVLTHFSVATEKSYPFRILLRACPARMDGADNECTRAYRQVRVRLKETIRKILEKGVASGQFRPVALDATSNLLIAMLYGLMHQQAAGLDALDGVEAAAIAFCENALTTEAATVKGGP
jgi:AcrR family transcriptional regulator